MFNVNIVNVHALLRVLSRARLSFTCQDDRYLNDSRMP